MNKEQFSIKIEKARKAMNEVLKEEPDFAYVMLIEAKDFKNNLTYNDILSNIDQNKIIGFVNGIMRIYRCLVGRNN